MSWLYTIFTGNSSAEDQAAIDRAEAWNREHNRQLHDRGLLTDDQYAATVRNDQRDEITDITGEVDDAFNSGLDQGAADIRNAVGSTVNTVVGTPLKLIPWQLWLAGAAFGAWKLGLLGPIIKAFKKGK